MVFGFGFVLINLTLTCRSSLAAVRDSRLCIAAAQCCVLTQIYQKYLLETVLFNGNYNTSPFASSYQVN